MTTPGNHPTRLPARLGLQLWPWAVIVGFTVWATTPLWTAKKRVFAGKLSTDNVVTPWFYDFVSRARESGTSIEYLSDLDWPNPYPTSSEFPALLDAEMAAPLGQLFDWPLQWGMAQAMPILANGLGFALLARGAGARGLGIAVAGCLGVVSRPVWAELITGRMNVAWPGLVAGAIGALLLAVDGKDRQEGERSWKQRVPWAIAAALLGCLAAGVYPPHLILAAPLALVLLVGPLRRGGMLGWLLMAAAIGGGLALAWPDLMRILATQTGRLNCGRVHCPDAYHTLAWARFFRMDSMAYQGLSLGGLAAGSAILAPLSLFWKRKWSAVFVAVVCAISGALSLGPCPEISSGQSIQWLHNLWKGPTAQSMWCRLESLHDYARLATPATLGFTVLSAWGIDALAGSKSRVRMVVAAAAGFGAVWWSTMVVVSESLDPEKWHAPDVPISAQFLLKGAAHGPVAELPFDRSQQFLSVLAAPGWPRVNPLKAQGAPRTDDIFIQWISAIGRGQDPRQTPTATQATASGVRWVIFDVHRCAVSHISQELCSEQVSTTIESVLGPGQDIGEGCKAWDLQDLAAP